MNQSSLWTDWQTEQDGRQHAPATERNHSYILEVLKDCLPSQGMILEIASGTGQHAARFAPALAPRLWQPSDPDPERLISIAAWAEKVQADNLLFPLQIDAMAMRWPVEELPLPAPISAIVCINMIHIAPFEACLGLLEGAARILPKDGVLYLYGPFKKAGEHTAPSNQDFDARLRQQDARWGVRDVDDVSLLASEMGFALKSVIEMPANNLSVIFERT